MSEYALGEKVLERNGRDDLQSILFVGHGIKGITEAVRQSQVAPGFPRILNVEFAFLRHECSNSWQTEGNSRSAVIVVVRGGILINHSEQRSECICDRRALGDAKRGITGLLSNVRVYRTRNVRAKTLERIPVEAVTGKRVRIGRAIVFNEPEVRAILERVAALDPGHVINQIRRGNRS